jgi:hypothetical protein
MPWDRSDQRNPDAPECGFYAIKLVKKGVECAARIQGPPTHFNLWFAEVNGDLYGSPHDDPQLADGVQTVWLRGKRITEAEYDYLLERYRHFKQHDPSDPRGDPFKPVNRRLMPPIGG